MRKSVPINFMERKYMPDRYEREIEDILRRQGDWGKPRRPGPRRSTPIPPLTFPERCLVIAVIAALVGGGWAYADGSNFITGIIAVVGAVCVALVALSSFLVKERPSPYRWR